MNNVQCINCKACLPCAADIDIPTVITFKDNISKIDINNETSIKAFLNDEKIKCAMSNAQFCKRCNRCVRCCPAHIDIPLEIILNLSEFKKMNNDHKDISSLQR